MNIKDLERANKIQERISNVEKAIQWLSSGGEVHIMANKQIGTSIEVKKGMVDLLITGFTKELESLNKEFEEI